MYLQRPFVEVAWDGDPIISGIMEPGQYQAILYHNRHARCVVEALSRPAGDFCKMQGGEREKIYRNLGRILDECPRLALYLPFYVLGNPTELFKRQYFDAWQKCHYHYDIREAFHFGDIYEPSARRGEPERVVKAFHLIPWLLEYGYIDEDDIIQYAKAYQNQNSIAIWGLYEGVMAAHQFGTVDGSYLDAVGAIVAEAKTPQPKPPELIKVTPGRQKWLEERERGYDAGPEEFKSRYLAGPFSKNIDLGGVQKLELQSDDEFYILHGSNLKGYSRSRSDYDAYRYNAVSGIIEGYPYVPERPELISHFILSGAWIGRHEEPTARAQLEAASRYYHLDEEKTRLNVLFWHEKTLLQYRLMHKGIICAYPNISTKTRELVGIDGDSPFYDDRYRSIAAQIYLKYIFLPSNN